MEDLTREIIIEHENSLYGAMKAGEVARLDELLHDQLLFVVPGGEVVTKQADLDNYRSGRLKVEGLLAQIDQLNIIGDVAVAVLTVELRGSFEGQGFSGRFRYIRCWKRIDGMVKVVGGSGTAI